MLEWSTAFFSFKYGKNLSLQVLDSMEFLNTLDFFILKLKFQLIHLFQYKDFSELVIKCIK